MVANGWTMAHRKAACMTTHNNVIERSGDLYGYAVTGLNSFPFATGRIILSKFTVAQDGNNALIKDVFMDICCEIYIFPMLFSVSYSFTSHSIAL